MIREIRYHQRLPLHHHLHLGKREIDDNVWRPRWWPEAHTRRRLLLFNGTPDQAFYPDWLIYNHISVGNGSSEKYPPPNQTHYSWVFNHYHYYHNYFSPKPRKHLPILHFLTSQYSWRSIELSVILSDVSGKMDATFTIFAFLTHPHSKDVNRFSVGLELADSDSDTAGEQLLQMIAHTPPKSRFLEGSNSRFPHNFLAQKSIEDD